MLHAEQEHMYNYYVYKFNYNITPNATWFGKQFDI